MKHAWILPGVEHLSARAGAMESIRVENSLARDIRFTRNTIATIFDDFYPSSVMFSSTVERLFMRFVVQEESLTVEKDHVSKFYLKKMAFLGIGGDALPSREMFQA